MNKLEKSKNDIQQLNDIYDRQFKTNFKLESNSESLAEAYRIMNNHLNELDRARLEKINKINAQIISLKADSVRYDELFNKFQGMKNVDSATIQTRIEQIDQLLKDTNLEIAEIRKKLTSLPHKRSIYDAAKARLGIEDGKLNALIREQGNIDEINQKIKKGEDQLKTIQKRS